MDEVEEEDEVKVEDEVEEEEETVEVDDGGELQTQVPGSQTGWPPLIADQLTSAMLLSLQNDHLQISDTHLLLS